jgi:hypothetical protein
MADGQESGHWYDTDGNSQYTIVGANGKTRNTTLRDARKNGFVPSVTTVLNIAAKPALENWKIKQAINSALKLHQNEDESLHQFIQRCKKDSQKVTEEAAEAGTFIHSMIEDGFTGKNESGVYKRVKKFLDEKFPDETWLAEESFYSELGYGGKIDLYSKSGIFVDFKTKDNLEGKDPETLAYDNYGMQLSAYAQGCGYVKDVERVSIFVDRGDTRVVLGHVWDKDTHTRHMEMFNNLLQYWILVKNYDPTKIN